MLEHATGRDKSWILAHGEHVPSPTELKTINKSLKQLEQGIPLPYVIGRWDFYGRTFTITKDVLIPRPETETLVDLAHEHLKQYDQAAIIDVGTGSGIIAISLAASFPKHSIIATDISLHALKVAQMNARQLAQTKIQFLLTDLMSPLKFKFDLICANLPYIPSQVLEGLAVSRQEPYLALDGGKSGLESIECMLAQSTTRLAPGGMVLLEIDSTLGIQTLVVAKTAFSKAACQIVQDLAGKDRIIKIQASP